MYLTHRTAVVTVASTVEYVETTAQLVHDARCEGVRVLAGDLEQRRRCALDGTLAVFTAAGAHAADLEAIQRYGNSMLARGDAVLRAKHGSGRSLTYAVPEISIPRDLYEIGQARVRAALRELTSDPIVDAAQHTRRRSRLQSAMPRSA
jgi:hypothetical protein